MKLFVGSAVGAALARAGVDLSDRPLEIEVTGWGLDGEQWSLPLQAAVVKLPGRRARGG